MMKKLSLIIAVLSLCMTSHAGEVFKIDNPDYKLSPFTGMTRNHWVEADKYLLEGAFRHIKSLDDPMYFDRLGDVCYPKDETNKSRVRGATLEGMARTLFMASPLIREDSTITINGIRLVDYYRRQLTLLVTPGSEQFISHRGNRGPCQDLVEFGALGVCFFVCGEAVWDPLPKETRDALYAMMESYADGPTVAQNWRFFNIFVMSFFNTRGYKINQKLMERYLNELLGDYRGSGWYYDVPNYDFYSMWAYQLYGKLWSKFYGEKYLPEYAAKFEKNFNEMYEGYPNLFGRDGKMPMWGRSNMYRFAATAPLAWGDNCNHGWMRRIASGCLLQFIQHPDFLYDDGVPTPGFYGLFDPVLQGYSCRGSVFWCAKAFLPLVLPDTDNYWSAVENEGEWATMRANEVRCHYYEGPKMLVTDYASTGAAEIRAYCDYNVDRPWPEHFRASEQYNRLAYNTDLPWMADGKNGEVAMNYVVYNEAKAMWEPMRRYTTTCFVNNILQRTAYPQANQSFRMLLHDIALTNGTLRADKVIASEKATKVRLGHYALPKKTGNVATKTISLGDGHTAYIINNGEYELAMIGLEGWGDMEFVTTKGLHPESEECVVIDAEATVSKGDRLVCLQLMTKKSFTKSQLRKSVADAKARLRVIM